MTTKVCSKCGEEKKITDFYKNQTWCKECIKAYLTKYNAEHKDEIRKYNSNYNSKNRDKIREYSSNYYLKHSDGKRELRMLPEHRDNKREYDKKYYTRSDVRERKANYRIEHRDEKRGYNTKYRAENWITNSLRGHKRRGINICTTQEELIKCKDILHCGMCGKLLQRGEGKQTHNTPHLDRIYNEDYMDKKNTQILCFSCNIMKGATPMDNHLKRLYEFLKTDITIIKHNPDLVIPVMNAGRSWARNTRNKHIAKGYNIVATVDEIQNIYLQTQKCPMCKCELKQGKGKLQSCSPSLDNITHKNKGVPIYISDLWVICHSCNTFKHNKTLPELKAYAEHVCSRWNVRWVDGKLIYTTPI